MCNAVRVSKDAIMLKPNKFTDSRMFLITLTITIYNFLDWSSIIYIQRLPTKLNEKNINIKSRTLNQTWRCLRIKHLQKSTRKINWETHQGLSQSEEGKCTWTYSKDGTIFTVCSRTFTILWLTRTSVIIKTFLLIFCLLFDKCLFLGPLHFWVSYSL